MKVIWLTKGSVTYFEYQYLTDVLLGAIQKEIVHDEAKFTSDANDSILVYSAIHGDSSNIARWLKGYSNYSLIHLSDEELSADIQLQKDLIWSFAGQLKSDRKKMINEFNNLSPNFVHLTNDWMDPKGLSASEVSQIMERTIFLPCPFGNVNPDSFRIMEGLEHGCIPVVISFLGHDYFKYTFGDHPFIIGRGWSDCRRQIEALLKDTNLLEKKYYEVIEWYRNYKDDLSSDVKTLLVNRSGTLKSKQFEYQTKGVSKYSKLLYKIHFQKWAFRIRLYRFYKKYISKYLKKQN